MKSTSDKVTLYFHNNTSVVSGIMKQISKNVAELSRIIKYDRDTGANYAQCQKLNKQNDKLITQIVEYVDGRVISHKEFIDAMIHGEDTMHQLAYNAYKIDDKRMLYGLNKLFSKRDDIINNMMTVQEAKYYKELLLNNNQKTDEIWDTSLFRVIMHYNMSLHIARYQRLMLINMRIVLMQCEVIDIKDASMQNMMSE